MWLRRLALILAGGYVVFSVAYIYWVGFADPQGAIRVGMAGIAVVTVGMILRLMARQRK